MSLGTYLREDDHRDYQRRPARSPQRAPRRHERDGERDLYPGKYARDDECRPRSPLYRLRGLSPEPLLPHYTEREAFHDGIMPRRSEHSPRPRHDGSASGRKSRSPPRERRSSYPRHQGYDDKVVSRRKRSPSRDSQDQHPQRMRHDDKAHSFRSYSLPRGRLGEARSSMYARPAEDRADGFGQVWIAEDEPSQLL
jgi:hypothetical protein